jgi:hypothetical protein
MNQKRFISTAVLVILLGTTLTVLAQKGEEQKGGGAGKAPQAQHQAQPQRAQQTQRQAQPQRTQQAQPQRAQQTQRQAQPQRAQQTQRQAQPQRAQQAQQSRGQQQQSVAYNHGNNGNQYGRISNANYGAHFGHGHSFHMGRPQMIGGYNRFQYGGYWFGYNQGWPIGWDYNDDCYVVYEDGAYYMYNLRHPGIHISLNIF